MLQNAKEKMIKFARFENVFCLLFLIWMNVAEKRVFFLQLEEYNLRFG